MARIASRAESVLDYEEILRRKRSEGVSSVPDAISYACCTAAMDLSATAIITATRTGSTAHLVSRYRPRSPIVATATVAEVARRLSIVWGVTPVLVKNTANTDEMIEEATRAALEAGFVKGGDMVVVTAGIPKGVRGSTNFLKVHIVGEIMVRGIGIGKKIVTGRVHVVTDPEDTGLQKGDIMVAVSTDAAMVPLMAQASAVIVEAGGLTSHAAIVGISMGLPVVVGADGATGILRDGMVVTVDTPRGHIYLGEPVDESDPA
jgi:pyruvate kinase